MNMSPLGPLLQVMCGNVGFPVLARWAGGVSTTKSLPLQSLRSPQMWRRPRKCPTSCVAVRPLSKGARGALRPECAVQDHHPVRRRGTTRELGVAQQRLAEIADPDIQVPVRRPRIGTPRVLGLHAVVRTERGHRRRRARNPRGLVALRVLAGQLKLDVGIDHKRLPGCRHLALIGVLRAIVTVQIDTSGGWARGRLGRTLSPWMTSGARVGSRPSLAGKRATRQPAALCAQLRCRSARNYRCGENARAEHCLWQGAGAMKSEAWISERAGADCGASGSPSQAPRAGRRRAAARTVISGLLALGAVLLLDANAQARLTFPPAQKLGLGGSQQVAADSQGRATVVWRAFEESDFLQQIKALRLGADGSPGSVHTLSEAGAATPQVAVDPQGRATVVWERGGGSRTVQSVRLGADGTHRGVKSLSQGISPQVAVTPQVAVDSRGRATVVWAGSVGSGTHLGLRVHSVRLGTDGSQGAVRTLSKADGYYPQVAVDSQGRPTVVWSNHGVESTRGRNTR